jgi:hypothetical protein
LGDNAIVQNRGKLVTGNLTRENRFKQRKSTCCTEFKVAMKSVRLKFEVNPPVQKNRVKLVIGNATASFGSGFHGTRPLVKPKCPDKDP